MTQPYQPQQPQYVLQPVTPPGVQPPPVPVNYSYGPYPAAPQQPAPQMPAVPTVIQMPPYPQPAAPMFPAPAQQQQPAAPANGAPAAPAPSQPQQPSAPAASNGSQSGGDQVLSSEDGDRGFPANTPIAQMTAEQREAYWRFHARKHESTARSTQAELDRLRTANGGASSQTDPQQVAANAYAQGRAAALVEGGARLVDGWIWAAAETVRLPRDSVNALLQTLDRRAFLGQDGSVDTARVYGWIASVAGVQGQQQAGAMPAAAGPGQPQYLGQPGYGQPYPPTPQPPAFGPPTAPPGMQWGAPMQGGYPGAGQPAVPSYPQQGWTGQQTGQPQLMYPTTSPPMMAPMFAAAAARTPDFGQGAVAGAPTSPFDAGKAVALARHGQNARSFAAAANASRAQ